MHARETTHKDVLTAVADLVGVDSPASAAELVTAVRKVPPPDAARWIVAVDGLDAAATGADRRQIAATLTDLAALPGFRVAVATRPMQAQNKVAPGALLPALGVRRVDDPALVDLDSDLYFDRDALESVTGALLAQGEAEHPGPPGHAWSAYRTDPQLRHRLAQVIAERSGRKFLVAVLATGLLSRDRDPVDPAAADFDPASIPSGIGEALDRYLDRLPEAEAARLAGLLTALAYSCGPGINGQLWLRFAAALGYPATQVDLDVLRGSPSADFLLQSVPEATGPVTALFHQALTDELRGRRPHPPSDKSALLRILSEDIAAHGWDGVDLYWNRYAADHAAAAGKLHELIEDVGFLGVADLNRLLPHLPDDPGGQPWPIAIVLRQVGARADPLPPARRRRLLALTAAHHGMHEITTRLATGCTDGVTPVLAHRFGPHTASSPAAPARWPRCRSAPPATATSSSPPESTPPCGSGTPAPAPRSAPR